MELTAINNFCFADLLANSTFCKAVKNCIVPETRMVVEREYNPVRKTKSPENFYLKFFQGNIKNS